MATDPKTPALPPTPEALPNAPLAYENPDFLDSPDARILRIMAEYQEPLSRFRRERIQDTIVFFGSARFRALDVAAANFELLANTGSREPAAQQPASLDEVEHGKASGARLRLAGAAIEMAAYYEDARELANMLATWAKSLPGPRHRFVITSGGGPGIMEAANRGAYEAGAKTIGLNIKLPFEQLPNPYITPSLNFDFHYFFMRKYWLVYLAKALVIFPGGFGTLDEMFEALTLIQTGKIKSFPVVIMGTEYWSDLLPFIHKMATAAMIAASDLELVYATDSAAHAVQHIREKAIGAFGLRLVHRPRPQRFWLREIGLRQAQVGR